MPVRGFDHVAVPTAHPDALIAFYKAFGFTCPEEDEWRAGRYPIFSLAAGDNKINVHPPGFTANLRGPTAVPGCGDFCFVWDGTAEELEDAMAAAGAVAITPPVARIGGRAWGTGKGTSVYTRDPDDNLVEFIRYE